MWFKKKSQISGFNPNTAYDGTDWRTNSNSYSGTPSQTLPSAADANNYFYLPALGAYGGFGYLNRVGPKGFYWSSSADPWNRYTAYTLEFLSGNVNVVSYNGRENGFRVEPTFE